jgi:hypothetical protein
MQSEYELLRVSDRPGFHSYFDVFPESPDGEHVVYFAPRLGEETVMSPAGLPLFNGRIVAADSDGDAAREVGPATRGNRQAGPRQQWLDNRTVAFVMPGGDVPRTVCVSVEDAEVRTVPGAIRMANPLGRREALTSSHESRANGFETDEEAVYRQDFDSGKLKRLFRIEDALALHPRRNEIKHPEHLQFKHTKWAPSGERFFLVFHHEHFRRRNPGADIRVKALMVAEKDGSGLHYASEFGSHPFWSEGDDTMYAFETSDGRRYMTAHPVEGGPPERTHEGLHANHASLSPDGRYLAMDSFQDPERGMASVWLGDLRTGEETRLAEFDAPDTSGVTGTHPHPVWSRDGRHIYFNAAEQNIPFLYKVAAPVDR